MRKKTDPNSRPYHVFYKLEHKGRNLWYWGIHSCEDPNDGYFGSGFGLKEELRKNGRDGWTKKVLHIYKTRDEALAKERQVVTFREINTKGCLNRIPGGWVTGWKTSDLPYSSEEAEAKRIANCKAAMKEYHSCVLVYPKGTENQKNAAAKCASDRWKTESDVTRSIRQKAKTRWEIMTPEERAEIGRKISETKRKNKLVRTT